MKKILLFLGFALMMICAVSCDKEPGAGDPFYRVNASCHYSTDSDFSNIFKVTDPYANKNFSSERAARSAYDDILSETKNAPYTADGEDYVKLVIIKYVATVESEISTSYNPDPTYKSPVSHIWDAKGSRDL